MSQAITPFEQIRRTNPAGNEFWSSRDFARVLGYTDYRNFEAVIAKARTACFNSGQRVEDHFVEITEMIAIGKGGQRPVNRIWAAPCPSIYRWPRASSAWSPKPKRRLKAPIRLGGLCSWKKHLDGRRQVAPIGNRLFRRLATGLPARPPNGCGKFPLPYLAIPSNYWGFHTSFLRAKRLEPHENLI